MPKHHIEKKIHHQLSECESAVKRNPAVLEINWNRQRKILKNVSVLVSSILSYAFRIYLLFLHYKQIPS